MGIFWFVSHFENLHVDAHGASFVGQPSRSEDRVVQARLPQGAFTPRVPLAREREKSIENKRDGVGPWKSNRKPGQADDFGQRAILRLWVWERSGVMVSVGGASI